MQLSSQLESPFEVQLNNKLQVEHHFPALDSEYSTHEILLYILQQT